MNSYQICLLDRVSHSECGSNQKKICNEPTTVGHNIAEINTGSRVRHHGIIARYMANSTWYSPGSLKIRPLKDPLQFSVICI